MKKAAKIAIEVLIFWIIVFLYTYFFERNPLDKSLIESFIVGFIAGISIFFFNKFMDNKKKTENAENN